MVGCAANGCSNRTGQFQMFRFPREFRRRLEWEARVKREDWHATEGSRLCATHFEPDMFETLPDGKVRLTRQALPTIFSSTTYVRRRGPNRPKPPSEDPTKKNTKREIQKTDEEEDVQQLPSFVGNTTIVSIPGSKRKNDQPKAPRDRRSRMNYSSGALVYPGYPTAQVYSSHVMYAAGVSLEQARGRPNILKKSSASKPRKLVIEVGLEEETDEEDGGDILDVLLECQQEMVVGDAVDDDEEDGKKHSRVVESEASLHPCPGLKGLLKGKEDEP